MTKWKKTNWDSPRGQQVQEQTVVGRCNVIVSTHHRLSSRDKAYRWHVFTKNGAAVADGTTNSLRAAKATAISRARGQCK